MTNATSRPTCLVIIPTYNEAPNIERLVAEVLGQGSHFDLLVVDDRSPDGTGDLVAALAADNSRIHLLRRMGKLGLGSAYIAGFRFGLARGYDFLFEMDADFSHQPHYLPQLLAAAEGGADIVLGSRYVVGGGVRNWSWLRKCISRGGSFYTRAILRLPVQDCTGGFKCFHATVLRHIGLETIQSNGYGFQVELTYRCFQAGYRISEVPIIFPDRVAGQSKMSGAIVREAARVVWQLRRSPNPYKSLQVSPDRQV